MIYIHPKTQALIFDCDGTIADSMIIHNNAWNTIAQRYKLQITTEQIAHYNGIPTLQILQRLTEGHGYEYDLSLIVEEKEKLAQKDIHRVLPIKPVVDIIEKYHRKLPMVVISGGASENVYKTLEALNLIDYFEFIITADDDHPTKESPEAFLQIAKRLGVKAQQCHVFEDGKPGLINAIKADMVVTDIRTFYP
ncbi:HAD family hydrolase [Facilibium subflavum]|uniref:HAD family hydrolase n=1 Tax=Facilibium subflavum TaxID=2219058 RepID=UPI000E64F1A4|nr:HAD-IA family hydrolase [Facilibium subflavum]